MDKIPLLNTQVNNVTMDEALGEIERLVISGKKSYLVAVNTDVVMKIENDPQLKDIVDAADMTFVDGKPLMWISKRKKRPIKEKISGSDLVPRLCALASQKGYSVFLLGGKEGVAEKAAVRLREKQPDINIVGTLAPPPGFEQDEDELRRINGAISGASPDLLIVCFGCPKQEKFISANIDQYDARVSVCAGATIDFLAGNVKRAPRWMSEHGLEWFYRFLQEPKRLFKRYFIDDIKILKLIRKYR